MPNDYNIISKYVCTCFLISKPSPSNFLVLLLLLLLLLCLCVRREESVRRGASVKGKEMKVDFAGRKLNVLMCELHDQKPR
jgi:hypothetical protein